MHDRIRGQLLAKINTDQLEAQVLPARASLEVAEARLLESQATVLEPKSPKSPRLAANRRDVGP